MGIFGALTTAVSGLRAQSYALENISGNIANSQTPGFKRVDTSFVDMMPGIALPPRGGGLGERLLELTNTIKGDPLSTSVATNVAINGEGFFMVQERVGYCRQPARLRQHRSLHPPRRLRDRQGRLSRNGAGFYLRGIVDRPGDRPVRATANRHDPDLERAGPGEEDHEILYKANLPSARDDERQPPLRSLGRRPATIPRHDPNALPRGRNDGGSCATTTRTGSFGRASPAAR